MATKEINFPFLISGKIGGVVGRVVNGKQVFSKLPRPRRGKPSLRELQARRNWAIAINFAKRVLPILRKYDEREKKGFNKAMSLILRNAMQGDHPEQRIDFSKVILGEGFLPNPKSYKVVSPAKGLLEFNWSLERRARLVSKSDRIFIAVYCGSKDEFRHEQSGAERRERQFLMDVSGFSGQQVEVYFGFASLNDVFISTSIYAGSIKVM